MKVAVVIDTWYPFIGGGQINAYEISKRLAKDNLYIDIITRNNGNDNLKLTKNLNVIKLGKTAKPSDSISKIVFQLHTFIYLLKHNYDIIHAHAFLPGITARLTMVIKKTPAIFTVHGTSINTRLNNLFSRNLEKFILTEILYSAQITVSRDFLNYKNINKKIFFISNGVDTTKFTKFKNSKNKKRTILFVGRLHSQKNLLNLLTATNILRNKFYLQLLIVGDGPQKNQLTETIKDLNLQKLIKMIGEVKGTNLIRLYKSSDILILPSIYEGQPLTLFESWAAKTPVIATKTGDCQYLIKNGQNGYLINNPQDSEEIAAVIEKALSNKNLSLLGQNGYNLVRKNFSWDKSAQETLKVYANFIKTPAYR